jgi:hypothetical protein
MLRLVGVLLQHLYGLLEETSKTLSGDLHTHTHTHPTGFLPPLSFTLVSPSQWCGRGGGGCNMWWGGGAGCLQFRHGCLFKLLGVLLQHLYRVLEERSKTLSGKKMTEVQVTGWRGSGCG